MKAVLFEKFNGEIKLANLDTPTPKPDGVVVKVLATGMCLSDWHGYAGHDDGIDLPHVPGHEWAGEIVAIGKDIKNFKVGDRVTAPFVGGCGHCYDCHSGNHQVCDHQFQPGFTAHGSFAEYVAIDYADTNLVIIPEEISNETACILGCRFITSFRAVAQQGQVTGGQWVAVHGCGGVGLSAIMIANALGASVIAVDINDDTLELAKSLGAVATINSINTPNVVEAVQEITKGGADVSVDALGFPQTCYNSIANLRKRGKHVQVGLVTGDPQIPMGKVIGQELEILGSHGMQAYKFREVLEMIRVGKFDPSQMIERQVSLADSVALLPKMNEFGQRGVTVINQF